MPEDRPDCPFTLGEEENSEKRIKTKKRPVVAPGEMEEILLGREELLKYPDLQQLIITVKEG